MISLFIQLKHYKTLQQVSTRMASTTSYEIACVQSYFLHPCVDIFCTVVQLTNIALSFLALLLFSLFLGLFILQRKEWLLPSLFINWRKVFTEMDFYWNEELNTHVFWLMLHFLLYLQTDKRAKKISQGQFRKRASYKG